MLIQQGLNSEDWQIVLSKIKRANLEQLIFMKEAINSEIIKRNKQDGGMI